MTQHDTEHLLDQLAQTLPEGCVSLDRVLAGAKAAHRRHTRRKRFAVAGAVVAVVGMGVGVPLAVTSHSDGHGIEVATDGGGGVGPTAAPAPTSDSPVFLDGTYRVIALVGPDGNSLLSGPQADQLEMTFQDGLMTGTSGCNDVRASYAMDARDLRFDAASMFSTTVGCEEPPLTERLLDVRHVSRDGHTIYLHAENWMIVVGLKRTPSTSASAPGLDCTRQNRTQAYLGRPFASMSKAANWGVPAGGKVGDILRRNKFTRVFAILDGSGQVVAEVGIERLDGGWARASRTTCA